MANNHTDEIKFLVDDGTREYFAWLRHILTLSSGGLTLLVALQGQFVPAHPRWLVLLKLSWVLLALSVVFALIGLAGYHSLYFRTAEQLLIQDPSNTIRGRHAIVQLIPEPHRTFGRLLPWIFSAAFICLCVFGIANL